MDAVLPKLVMLSQALVTPVIAVAAISIAALQLGLARQRMRMDLFEKRHAVFESTRELISKLVHYGDLSWADVDEFKVAISNARFLFGPEVFEYVDKIRGKAQQIPSLSVAADKQNNAAAVDEHRRLVDELTSELLVGDPPPLVEIFGRYLSLTAR